MSADLEERARQRAQDAQRERDLMSRGEERLETIARREFVLATSKWGWLGQGAFCYLAGLFLTIALAGLFVLTARPIGEPHHPGDLSFGVKCALCALPFVAATALYILVPARLRRTSAARVLAASASLPVQDLAEAIGRASDGSRRTMTLELTFVDRRPEDPAVLALARQVHPDAQLDHHREALRLAFPRGASSGARLLKSDGGRSPEWFVRRQCLELWEDLRVVVLEPLHASHPLAAITLRVG